MKLSITSVLTLIWGIWPKIKPVADAVLKSVIAVSGSTATGDDKRAAVAAAVKKLFPSVPDWIVNIAIEIAVAYVRTRK